MVFAQHHGVYGDAGFGREFVEDFLKNVFRLGLIGHAPANEIGEASAIARGGFEDAAVVFAGVSPGGSEAGALPYPIARKSGARWGPRACERHGICSQGSAN